MQFRIKCVACSQAMSFQTTYKKKRSTIHLSSVHLFDSIDQVSKLLPHPSRSIPNTTPHIAHHESATVHQSSYHVLDYF